MKHLTIVFLFIGIAMFYIGCSDNDPTAPELNQSDQETNTLAKEPLLILTGDAYTDFTPWLAPEVWNGTVEFDNVVYGITYTSLTPPRLYSSASPFIEDWVIYEYGQPGNVYMKGTNRGVTNSAHKPDPTPFVGNGKITEAYGLFAMWVGRSVHEQGLIYWLPDGSIPDHAEFIFRLN